MSTICDGAEGSNQPHLGNPKARRVVCAPCSILPFPKQGADQFSRGWSTTTASPKEIGLDIGSEQTAQQRFVGLFAPSDRYADAINNLRVAAFRFSIQFLRYCKTHLPTVGTANRHGALVA